VGYVPKNNSPRIGFRGFFSFFDYKLVLYYFRVGYGFVSGGILSAKGGDEPFEDLERSLLGRLALLDLLKKRRMFSLQVNTSVRLELTQ
jgi:hypothetical protein